MDTWTSPAGQGANMIFAAGKELQVYRPNTDGVSRFRPIPRPYPSYILEMVPEFLPKATELAQSMPPAGDQYRQHLRAAALELCTQRGVHRVIVDADKDLANATRQAVITGAVPQMEWWRHGNGSTDIGAWALSLDIASFWGVKSMSIIDHERPDPNYTPEQKECAERETKGVFRKIFDELNTAAKADPRWNQYIKVFKQNQHGANRPQRMGILQVFLYEHNGKAAQQPVHVLFLVNPTTLKSLEATWNQPLTGPGTDPPEDFLNGFVCGDLLDPDRGCMITAYDQNAMQTQKSGGAFGSGAFGGGSGGGGNRTNYVATIQAGQPLPHETSMQFFQQWDELLWIPTRTEAWMKALDSMGPHATAIAGRHEIPMLPSTIHDLALQYAQAESQGGLAPPVPSQVPGAPPAVAGPFGGPPAGGAPQGFIPPANPAVAGAPPMAPVPPPAAAPGAPALVPAPAPVAPAAPAPAAAVPAPARAPGAAVTAPPAPPAAPAVPTTPVAPAPAAPAPGADVPGAPQPPAYIAEGQQPAGATAVPPDPATPAPAGAPAAPGTGPDPADLKAAVDSLPDALQAGHSPAAEAGGAPPANPLGSPSAPQG